MKKFFLIIVLFAGSFSITNAQLKIAEDSAKAEIKQLTIEWNKAIINRDSLALEKILCPDYTLQGSLPRNKWVNNTLHHFLTDSLQIRGEQNIKVYGDAASSEAIFYWKASFDGKPRINSEYLVNDIWKRNDGHWQVLIRMTKIYK